MAVGASAVVHVIPADRVVAEPNPPPDPVEGSTLHLDAVQTHRLDVWRPWPARRAACVSRRQLRAPRLLDARAIYRWIAPAGCVPVHRGVYAVGHLPRTAHAAAGGRRVLACGDERRRAIAPLAAGAHGLIRPRPADATSRPHAPAARPGIACSSRPDVEPVVHRRPPVHDGRAHARRPRGLRPVRRPREAPCARRRYAASSTSRRSAESLARLPAPARRSRSLRAILDDPSRSSRRASGAERDALRALIDRRLAAADRATASSPAPANASTSTGPTRRLVLEIDGPTHDAARQRSATAAATRCSRPRLACGAPPDGRCGRRPSGSRAAPRPAPHIEGSMRLGREQRDASRSGRTSRGRDVSH